MTSDKMKVNVKIKKLHDDAVIPRYVREMDAGFDLVAVEDVIIEPGQSAKVPIGLAIALPEGYELQIRPRSGLSANTKLRISNAPGTIDAGYRGEICVLMDNTRPLVLAITTELDTLDGLAADLGLSEVHPHGTYLVRKGDRIAQGVLAAVPIAQFEVVDELDDTERSDGGFGSSGVTS